MSQCLFPVSVFLFFGKGGGGRSEPKERPIRSFGRKEI